jgi:hypothetical protein
MANDGLVGSVGPVGAFGDKAVGAFGDKAAWAA